MMHDELCVKRACRSCVIVRLIMRFREFAPRAGQSLLAPLSAKTDSTQSAARGGQCGIPKSWTVFSRREQEERRVQILVPDSRSVPPIQSPLPLPPHLPPSPTVARRTAVSSPAAPVLPALLRPVAPVTLKGAKARIKKSRAGPATRISGAASVHTRL